MKADASRRQDYELKEVSDIVHARRSARIFAASLGFGLADQTRLATAVSELSRNALEYAGGGLVTVMDESNIHTCELKVMVKDNGPGIANIPLALSDGVSTSGGLGAGLPGCKRLMDGFDIQSQVGLGTTVTIYLREMLL